MQSLSNLNKIPLSAKLNDLFEFSCVCQRCRNEALFWDFHLLLVLPLENNCSSREVDYPFPLKKIICKQFSGSIQSLLTACAKVNNSDWFVKNSNVAASLRGRLSYAVSWQLAISFLEWCWPSPATEWLVLAYLIVPTRLFTKYLYSSAGASSRAFQTLL